MEIFTLAVALLGAIGTISSWLVYFWNKRTSINFEIQELSVNTSKGMLFYGTITNNANSNIVITDIVLLSDKDEIHVNKVPTVVLTEEKSRNGVVLSHKETYNAKFPINLFPCSGQSDYFHFVFSSQNPLSLDTILNFEIHTNRKNRIRFSFQRDKLNRRHQNI
jgi:hypothetical protein